MEPRTLTGTLTCITADSRNAQFDGDPGTPRHLERLFLSRWRGDADLVGKRVRIGSVQSRVVGLFD